MTGNDTQQRLTAFIGRETEYWDFWGTIRIVKNGNILWETSRGYACPEFGVKNTMSTRFTVASVTKQFPNHPVTASGLLREVTDTSMPHWYNRHISGPSIPCCQSSYGMIR